MIYCDLTLPSPEENLACDEALLDVCEEGETGEVLRFWEPEQYFVVVGYANQAATEVNLPFCEAIAIPVLRRCTGGGTVLQGPGCLNYALILCLEDLGPLQSISGTNEFILRRHQQALAEMLGAPVELRGHTDLAIGGLKFSGNAQRRKRHCLIFHGSFLLEFDIEMIAKALPMPSKQPEYRRQRAHGDFLRNLNMPAERVKSALRKAWNAAEPYEGIPFERVSALVRAKYGRDDWNRKF